MRASATSTGALKEQAEQRLPETLQPLLIPASCYLTEGHRAQGTDYRPPPPDSLSCPWRAQTPENPTICSSVAPLRLLCNLGDTDNHSVPEHL